MNEITTDTEGTDEEILVYASFDDSIDVDQYRSIHVLGVNESNPIIQMDDTFFTGKFENALGTYMFFEEELCAQSEDPLLDRLPEKNLKYVTKTRKLLEMKQACVAAKEAQEIPSQSTEDDNDIEAISFGGLEEALAKFKGEFELEEGQQQKPSVIESGLIPKID